MYHFFKISYFKLSILVFGLLLVGIYSGEYKAASLVSTLFVGTAFVIDILHQFEKKSHDKRSSIVEK